jgi:nanoRNase/pAp phosphatase (c-di-AMP/oligoRNAs hydrolase)
VSSHQHTSKGSKEVADGRPLLLVISESAELARVRSRDREVCRWVPDGSRGGEFGGDPTDAACFAWVRDARAVTGVIDLQPSSRAQAALAALRSVRPDAAVLVLSDEAPEAEEPGDGTLARRGALREVLRLDLDEELERLEAERRAYCLRRFAEGDDVVPILIHNDPDPDAVSSALAVVRLLGGSPDRTPIVTFGGITRPENQRMAELLHIRVTQITRDELLRFERVVTVDTQPRGLQQSGKPRFAVIDHHPDTGGYEAAFRDVRPEAGATATIMTEYVRAVQGERMSRALATALLFGIQTDTDSLTRGVTPADIEAFGFLQAHADLQLVRRLQRPSFGASTARAFGAALHRAEYDGDVCVAWLGDLAAEEGHVLADLADFCIAIENVTWSVAAARLNGDVVLTLRHTGGGPGAGDLAQVLAADGGSGGGHDTMARVVLPPAVAQSLLGDDDGAGAVAGILRLVRDGLARVDDRASRPG